MGTDTGVVMVVANSILHLIYKLVGSWVARSGLIGRMTVFKTSVGIHAIAVLGTTYEALSGDSAGSSDRVSLGLCRPWLV